MRPLFLARILAAALAVSVALLVPDVLSLGWGLVVLMVVLVVLLLGFGIWIRAEKRLPLLCDPMVLVSVFFAQFYVIGPLCLPSAQLATAFRVPVERVVVTLALFLLMHGSFIVGYQTRLGAVLADALPDFGRSRMKLPGRWSENLILIASALGCAGFWVGRGGMESFLRLGFGQGRSSPFFLLAYHALIAGTLLMAWRVLTSPTRTRLDVPLFAALLVTEVIFFAIILAARKRLFFLFFGLFAVWLLRYGTSKLSRWVAASLMAFLLLFFSVWGTVRALPTKEILKGIGAQSSQYSTRPVHMGYVVSVAEPFAVACMIVGLFPDTEPYRYGGTLMVSLLGFIPRAVWPEKPVGIGKELTRYTDGADYDPAYGHSIATTLMGDYYANLGLAGVIVGGLGFGILCRIVAAYASKGLVNSCQRNPARVLAVAVFLASLVEIRGDIAGMLAFYGMTYPPLVFALLFFRLDYEQSARA